jgi:hypothetical protein
MNRSTRGVRRRSTIVDSRSGRDSCHSDSPLGFARPAEVLLSACPLVRCVAELSRTGSRRRLRRRWPGVSAALCLRRPARRTPGHSAERTDYDGSHVTQTGRVPCGPARCRRARCRL